MTAAPQREPRQSDPAEPAVHKAGGRGTFVWPPRQPAKPPPPEAFPPDSASSAPGRRSLWRLLEDYWLAPTVPPLQERIRESGWAPDRPGVYCDRCGVTVGPHEADEFGCSACRDRRLPWHRFVRLGEYRDELADWIRDLKFRRVHRIGPELGEHLGRALLNAGAPRRDVAVVPVGMSWPRRFLRGRDHSVLLAQGMADALGAPVVHALRRSHRPSQRAVPASRRRANVARSFHRRWGVDLHGWTVILIDDVRTSGATLSAASRVLSRSSDVPTDIWAAVVAVTPTPGRSRPVARRGIDRDTPRNRQKHDDTAENGEDAKSVKSPA